MGLKAVNIRSLAMFENCGCTFQGSKVLPMMNHATDDLILSIIVERWPFSSGVMPVKRLTS